MIQTKYIEHQYGNVRGMSKRDVRRLALTIEEQAFKNLPRKEQEEIAGYLTKSRLLPEPNWQEEMDKGCPSEMLIALKTLYAYSPVKIAKITDTLTHRIYYEKLQHFYAEALNFALVNPLQENIFNAFLASYRLAYQAHYDIIQNYFDSRNAKFEGNELVDGINFEALVSSKIQSYIKILKDTDVWIKHPKIPFFRPFTRFEIIEASTPIYRWIKGDSIKDYTSSAELLASFLSCYNELMKEQKIIPSASISPRLSSSNSFRQGFDYRQGADVNVNQLQTTFGLRGVEFGESLPQHERQTFLNHCYDACMDLAKLFEIRPFLIGHGELSLCFGSRGSGKAAAHYRPSTKEINLTRLNGVGTLAHELGHFYDYVIAEYAQKHTSFFENDLRTYPQRNTDKGEVTFSMYIQELQLQPETIETKHNVQSLINALLPWIKNPKLKKMLLSSVPNPENHTQNDIDTFSQIVLTSSQYLPNTHYKEQVSLILKKLIENNFEFINTKKIWIESDYFLRSTQYAKNEHDRRANSEVEMFARAIEKYVLKLFPEGERNDFLVSLNGYPIPNDEEMDILSPIIKKYFDKYFKQIEMRL